VGLISRPRSASNVEKFTYSAVTPCTRVPSIDLSRYEMRLAALESSITAVASVLKRRMARRSCIVMRGLLRTFSNSSSLRVIGNC
jgi:hypothetical protein